MYGNFKYFRHDPRRDNEVADAINDLDGRVTALEDLDPGERLDAAEAAINENGMRIGELVDRLDSFRLHSHQSNVTNYYVANYGSDTNDGSREHPFRTLIPIFDPAASKVNLKDTAIRIDFLTTGTFDAFETEQAWPWFNGVFIRFVGPTRTTMPQVRDDMPIVNFNCKAVSFSNAYIGADYVTIQVGTGEYDPDLGQNYNRMHLNNTTVIAKMVDFREWRHSPHGGHCSYVDCLFHTFGCTDAVVDFGMSIAGNDYAFTASTVGEIAPAFACYSSHVNVAGAMRFRRPSVNTTTPCIRNHCSVIGFGGNIGYYGSDTAMYNHGLSSTYGINMLSDVRNTALEGMGVNGNEGAGLINLRVRGNVVIG